MVEHYDRATGRLLHRYSTSREPDGVLRMPCKTRRASRCQACAEVYRADTYHLVRAGLVGGKGVPESVASHPYGKRIEGTTKTGRTRVVPIDQETVRVLKEHRRQQAADKLQAGEQWGGIDDYVFTTRWGDPIHPDTVSSFMALLIDRYNHPKDGPKPAEPLAHAHLHDLRHIHATTLLLAGVPVHVVAARLGHADPSVTLRVYAHVIRTAEASAAETFTKTIAASLEPPGSHPC